MIREIAEPGAGDVFLGHGKELLIAAALVR
jgi:hypothetical protein